MEIAVRAEADGASFRVKVQPGAGRAAAVGIWDGALKLKLSKKPEGGAANTECLTVLAGRLGVKQADVCIASGAFSHRKVIRVRGLAPDTVRERLQAWLDAG